MTQGDEPALRQMPAMLRRRAGMPGKMALEVAYQCLDAQDADTPVVFCSRHGEVARAVKLLADLVRHDPLSPTEFGLAVHNASAGLFSIARTDRENHIALAAGASTVEHGVIEACGLLADGASKVLLVVYDSALPAEFSRFEDCREQPHAWAWLMGPASDSPIHLQWHGTNARATENATAPDCMPPSLKVWRFYMRGDASMERVTQQHHWHWTRDA
ncbi:beta-ketoacyl synthase chain length factor [Oxalicibacterium solurbis]|uniref:3-oxoacyl-ACP synthase n=1 Tax=Oxalicibacterium solurbis TaxID=69280 RepID=A0A8J3AVY0_9BURK|nr:3-oxoacyl-ACP synthase [Oxalicibacterium solurbis]